jgi:hypothetical protein
MEPGIIDISMIMKVLEEDRPAGKVGRLVKEEGILLQEVTFLRLEFLS